MSDNTTTERLSEQAHESMDRVAKTAGKGKKRIRHEAANAGARVRDAGQKAKERSDDSLQSIDAFVHNHPLLSLTAAFTAGALLAALQHRRS